MRHEGKRLKVAGLLTMLLVAIALPVAAARAPQRSAQCPDPTILVDGATSQAVTLVCTGDGLPTRSASSIRRLSAVRPRSAFARGGSPRWAKGEFWGPDLEHVGNSYLLYFSVRRRGDGRHCIGVAVSSSPGGGFRDLGAPLLDNEPDGAIDPALVTVGQRLFLFYKRDGNSVGAPSVIFGLGLTADGLHPMGRRVGVVQSRRGGWEQGIVEGPAPIHLGNTTYLLYSEGRFYRPRYAEGEALLTGYPLGHYRRVGGPPVLSRSGRWVGTGGASIVVDGDRLLLAYAAFQRSERTLQRLLFIRDLRVRGGVLRPVGPARLIPLRGK